MDWHNFIERLRTDYPVGTHRILPPCDQHRIEETESQLGKFPRALSEMLGHFNGAELFVKAVPLVTIFGISTVPPLSASDWAPEWYIEKFTTKWRASKHALDEWPIAMMNYGVLIILDSRGMTKEWDTSQHDWGERELDLHERMEDLLREGDVYLNES